MEIEKTQKKFDDTWLNSHKDRFIYETYYKKAGRWEFSYAWPTMSEATNQAEKLEKIYKTVTKVVELVL